MTAKKPMPEIARCACGRKAVVNSILNEGKRFSAHCKCGWAGKWMKSARAAVLAWNKVMTAKPALWMIRNNLCHRIEAHLRTCHPLTIRLGRALHEIDKIRSGK